MKRSHFVLLALLLAGASLHAQIDSLRNLYKTTDSDSVKMEVLNELIAYTAYNDINQALRFGHQFDSIATTTANDERIAHGKKLLGICYYVAEQYDRSVQYYLAALEGYKVLHDTFDMGMIHNNIGSIYDVTDDVEQALAYFGKAKTYFDQTNDLEWQALIRQNLATQYEKIEKPDTALIMYQEALDVYERPEVKASAYGPLYNSRLAMVLVNLSRIHALRGENELSISYGERALSLSDVELDPYTLMQAKNALGKAYLEEGNLTLATANLGESLQWSRELDNNVMTANNLGLLAEAYQYRGDFRRAFEAKNEQSRLVDTLFNERREQAMNELITRYDTEQKEQEIALLQSSNQIKDLQIAKVQRERWLWGGGLLMVLTLAGIFFFFFRLNSHKNQLLAEQNNVIQRALNEKEALLREIHHRVKNNLQVISSLLSLQERRMQGEAGALALQESRNRVQSIALIHQHLYQQEDVSRIRMPEYFSELVKQVQSGFAEEGKQVDINLSIDDVRLDVDSVIPLGLIANELLTNAYKYAFRQKETGRIELAFQREQDGAFLLCVSDDGIGLPTEQVDGKSNSFGMKLIRTFASKLKSEVQIASEAGTRVSLHIPSNQLNQVA